MLATERKHVLFTTKDKGNIVGRLKEGKWGGGKLTERYDVGTATFSDIKISAEWILKFVSVPASKDGSSTGQIVRRDENAKVQDVLHKRFLLKRSQNQTLSGPILCEKALIFASCQIRKWNCMLIFYLYVTKYVA